MDKEKMLKDWWDSYTIIGKEEIYKCIKGKTLEESFNEQMGEHCVRFM